jgi:ABC-type uncharacterized transport system substrate-binding protein
MINQMMINKVLKTTNQKHLFKKKFKNGNMIKSQEDQLTMQKFDKKIITTFLSLIVKNKMAKQGILH